MTPKDYKATREQIGTQEEVAAMLDIARPTLGRREIGKATITKESELAILHLLSNGRRELREELKTSQVESTQPEPVTISLGQAWHQERVFLTLAEKLGIPESFALNLHRGLARCGFKDSTGAEITSPGSFLNQAWRSVSQSSDDRQENGKRHVWQIDAEIKATKDELARIEGNPELRNEAHGHRLTWDEYRAANNATYRAELERLYEECKETLKTEFSYFTAHFSKVGGDLFEEFQKFLPNDVPGFSVWARDWSGNPWIDPKGLIEDAKAEAKILKQYLTKLENERKDAVL